jgi:uncharacterized protein YaeQ
MALSSTLYRFQIELADIDRGVYESLDLRVPCHPSEDAERLVVRVLARAIAHEEGLEFGRGLSNSEEPALWTQSATGEVKTWIDVGIPGAERLHRANKRAQQLRIFTHKLEVALRKEWSSRAIHKAESIEINRLPPALIQKLADGLDRNTTWYLTLQEGQISVADGDGDKSVEGEIDRSTLAAFLEK